MLDIRKIGLVAHQISNNSNGGGIAVDATPGYGYENGKKTDKITHIVVETVFPDNGYEKVRVKVKDLKIPLTKEQLIPNGKKVAFKGLVGKIYRTNTGEYAISATADSLEVLP